MDRVMTPTAANRQDRSGEAALWLQHLAVLRQALLMRKPDAQHRIRSETAKLEREVEAMSARRKLAVRAARGGMMPVRSARRRKQRTMCGSWHGTQHWRR